MKKFLSLLLGFTLLLTSFGSLSVSAAPKAISLSDASVSLRKQFKADLKQTYEVENDGHIGIPVVYSTFRRDSVPSCETVALYVVGHKEKRVGTDSDEKIVEDLLSRGFIVTVLDYLDNPLAVGSALSWSVQKIRSTEICSMKKYVAGIKFKDGSCHVLPAGYNVDMGIYFYSIDTMAPYGVNEYIIETYNMYYAGKYRDNNGEYLKPATSLETCLKRDGTPINMDLTMDIVYPTNPKQTVPVFAFASSSETFLHCVNVATRPYFTKSLFEGYAGAVYEHEYIPMSRDDHFGYLDARFSLDSYAANSVHSAAIRRIRYLKDKYGYNGDYISDFGFSKSSGGPAVLANKNHETMGEYKTLDKYCPEGKSPTDSPAEQPWLCYEGTNEKISSDVTVVYAGAGTGINRFRDWCITDDCVPFIASIGTLDNTAGFRWEIPEVKNHFDSLTSESCFLIAKDTEHTPAYKYDEEQEADHSDVIWEWLDNHIRAAYRKEAPKVLWMIPKAGSVFASFDDPIEIKFSRAMDISSLDEGVKITRLADNKIVKGHWTSMHGDTTVMFTSANIIPGSKYLVEITDKCKAADGVYLKEQFSKTFAIMGDEFLTASSNTTSGSKENGLSIDNGTGKTSEITFNRKGGYGDVVRASLVLNRKNNQNAKLKVTADGFSALHPVDNTIEVIDVSSYVKNAKGENLIFNLASAQESGNILNYDFESADPNDFKANTHYRWGGESSRANYSDDAKVGSHSMYISNHKANARIKFLNSVGKSKLTSEDLGSSFKASFWIKTEENCSVTCGMYAKDGTAGYDAYDPQTYFVKANEWTEIKYSTSLTKEMVDVNTTCFTVMPLQGCNYYLDDVKVSNDSAETLFSSIESAASDSTALAPTLILFTPKSNDRTLVSATMVSSGEFADTVIDSAEISVDGLAEDDITGTKKQYIKMPLANVNTGNTSLSLNVNTDGKTDISIYGVLDDPSKFADNWTKETLTWNNAFANEKDGFGVDLNKVYGNKALSEITTAVSCTKSINVTDYVKYMKSKGYSNATFIIVSNAASETVEENFNTIKEFTNYRVSAQLNGFKHGLTADPKNPDNQVLYFEKSGTNKPINGFYQCLSLVGYLGTNGRWTKEDIGTKYTVSFKQYNASPNETNLLTGHISVTSDLGYDHNVLKTKRTVVNPNGGAKNAANTWLNVTYTFTVQEDWVNNHKDRTSIIIASGYVATATYIDDLKVVKEVGNVNVTSDSSECSAVIDGSTPDSISSASDIAKTPVTKLNGLSKAYYTFDKKDVVRIDDAKLTLDLGAHKAGDKLLVYGLNEAVGKDLTWNNAYANTDTNKVNGALAHPSTPIEIVLNDSSSYTVNVTDFIYDNAKKDNISFLISAADGTDKTVIKNAVLNISGSGKDESENIAEIITPKQDEQTDSRVMFTAESRHSTEKTVSDAKFYIDGVLSTAEIFKNGDTYITYADLGSGKHSVYAVLTYTDGTDKTSKTVDFTVKGAPVIKGDVNGDGTVNASDLALIKKKIAGLINDDSTAKYPDVNGDGSVNASDLAVLKKIIAGLI